MKDKKLHLIGNAHLDPVWLWQWQEGMSEVHATFRSALDRMNEYPEFVFTCSSAAFYEWIERTDPAMFDEIKQRVREGRWRIVGGWWVQPDCNLPSGESFVRQGLYAQHYFRDKFGVIARTGYCVDSFGHNAMLPQILNKSGMHAYVLMRPSPHEKGLPSPLFWWESDDGSRVLAFRILYEYCTWGKDVEQHVRRCAEQLKPPLEQLMCFYGVGNHGGGPTRENLESLRRLNNEPDLPRLVHSSPDDFFEEIRAQNLPLPVVHGELQHHASGCYAAHSGVKRWNRQTENLLLTAEKFASLAHWLTGQPYPTELKQAWKSVLFNQFHDILAGTSIEAAYDDARAAYGEAQAIGSRALYRALQSLTWNIHIEPEEASQPVVVFNPHSWGTHTPVEVEFGGWQEGNLLVDDAGRAVPVQIIRSAATAKGRSRLVFLADLPPLGYRVYRVLRGTESTQQEPRVESPALMADDTRLENARLRLEIHPDTGTIRRLYDKQAQTDVFLGAAARPVVIDDPSDTWGHNVFRFDKVVGDFRARRVRLIERGPVRAALRVESEFGASRLVQDFILYAELACVEVRVSVDWREQRKLLKLRFPLNLNNMESTYEIPYGHLERSANGDEEPGQSWVDVSGLSKDTANRYGLSLLNDGKYSFDVNIRDIGLTVLRSPIYAHHMPVEPEPDGDYAYIDQGLAHFTYTLLPHAGGWEAAGTVRRAAELNARPHALVESYHPQGQWPQCDSYVQVNRENVIVSALKQAEESEDLVLRCYETAQTATEATIRLPRWRRTIRAHFDPCELKTFRIPRDEQQPVVETNLLEWPE